LYLSVEGTRGYYAITTRAGILRLRLARDIAVYSLAILVTGQDPYQAGPLLGRTVVRVGGVPDPGGYPRVDGRWDLQYEIELHTHHSTLDAPLTLVQSGGDIGGTIGRGFADGDLGPGPCTTQTRELRRGSLSGDGRIELEFTVHCLGDYARSEPWILTGLVREPPTAIEGIDGDASSGGCFSAVRK